ncbi:MAG TPA: FHA domain-containing protein, partial [Polyangiaceae bacterium]|nr:FHA domain-containing protein [Polyangiaceae bacterium]
MDIEVVIDSQGGRRIERISAVAPISVGRSPSCTVCLESDAVSRRHAVFQVGPNSVVVEDVSTNGTIAGQQLLRRIS